MQTCGKYSWKRVGKYSWERVYIILLCFLTPGWPDADQLHQSSLHPAPTAALISLCQGQVLSQETIQETPSSPLAALGASAAARRGEAGDDALP